MTRIFSWVVFLVSAFASLGGNFEEEFNKHIVFSNHQENRIGYIEIGGKDSAISEATWLFVKAALDKYKKTKPLFIVLKLNTPGGEVFSAEKISDALKQMDTQEKIPVVAYIDNWAMSAGALLAYSCRFITVVKDGSMGAAEPVIQGTSGQMETASEKVNSAFRSDFASRAQFFDRNPFIAAAMVDKNEILVERDGKIIKVDREEEIHTTDTLLKPKGKLLTLTAEQLIKWGVADLLVSPERTESLSLKEEKTGKWPADKLLLFHAPYFKTIPNAVIDVYQMDWKTAFFVFLAHPVVSSLLFLGVVLGFYLEFTTPGFAVAGSVALTCLFLLILSSFSLQLGGWLEVIFLFSGLAILAVELFVLPTFGLLGFVGIVFFCIGFFGLLLPSFSMVSFDFDSKTFNAAGQVFFERLGRFSAMMLLSFLIIWILAKTIHPKWKLLSRLVLIGGEQDTLAETNLRQVLQIGEKGIVFANLRPSGKILVNERVFEAISQGELIEKGREVIVVRLEGGIPVVRAC